MVRRLWWLVILASTVTMLVSAQDERPRDKNLDIRSPVGDMHVGSDADAKKIGIPLYPGAQLKNKDQNNDQANLSILTEQFGMKLLVASYVSGDDPAKVIDFYRDKLKKYGKVLECHSSNHGGNIHSNDSKHDKQLKCDGDDSGPVTELKAGTEDNQHDVAIEPGDQGKGTKFVLIYLRTRGQQADI